MKDRKRLSVVEIRRRVRRHLMAEASLPGTGPWARAAKDMSTTVSKKTLSSNQARFRGFVEGSTKVSEAPSAAMDRFLVDLKSAEPGDVFYLTYGLGEIEVEKGVDSLTNETGEPIVRNSTKTLDLIKSTLYGEYQASETEEESEDPDVIERREVLSKASSPLAFGQKLVSQAMEELATGQKERIQQLKETIKAVSSGAGISRKDAVESLGEILRLSSDLTEQLKSDDVETRKKGVQAVLSALHTGKASLTPDELRREDRLVQAAQLLAFGTSLVSQAIGETGIPGTGTELITPSSEESRVYGRNAQPGTRRVISPISYGRGEAIVSRMGMLGAAAKSSADDILLGACISDQRFANLRRVVPAQVYIAKMEANGLPLTVLMTTIELLINTIRYDPFKGAEGYFASHRAGKVPPTSSVSSLMWATHLEPDHTVSLAEGFLSNSTHTGLANNRRGNRTDNHAHQRVDRIMRVIRDAKADVLAGSAKGVQGTDSPEPAAVVERFNKPNAYEWSGTEDPTTLEEVTAVMKAQGDILRIKSDRLRLDSPEAEKLYSDNRKGSTALATSMMAREVAIHQAESFIYERVLRRLLFGVTLRCVGKRRGVVITQKAIRRASESGMSTGEKAGGAAKTHTTQDFPIFEAMIERPKQSSINIIQDPEQRRKMIDTTLGASSKGQSQKDALEGGSKIESPGEMSTSKRKSEYHKSVVVTPNVGVNFSMSDVKNMLESGGDVLSLVSDEGSYSAQKPFNIPYIEKVIKYEQNMTPERVMRLESMYDSRLRPLRVTVQLLGAKKFSDPSNAKRSVGFTYLTPIPEMGITPSDYTPITEITGTAAGVLGSASRDARRIRGARGAADVAVPAGFSSYDLTGRIKEDANISNPLRADAVRAVERLKRDLEEGGANSSAQHKMRVYNGIVRDLQMSHSMDGSAFETLLNSRAVLTAINGLVAEATRIVRSDVASVSNDILEVKNLAGPGSAIAGIADLGSRTRMEVDPADRAKVKAVFRAISDGLMREVDVGGTHMVPKAAMSVIVRAAFGTMRNPSLATSPNAIRSRVMSRRSSAGDIVYSAGAGPGGVTATYPQVVPLIPALDTSKAAAKRLLEDIQRLNIQDAARSISGTITHAEVDDDLEALGNNLIPVEVLETVTSVRTLSGIVRGYLASNGNEMRITQDIARFYEELERFSSELNESGFGKRAREAGRVAASVSQDRPRLEVNYTRPKTILGEFLLLANSVLVEGTNSRRDIDDLLESAVTRLKKSSVNKRRVSEFAQSAVAVAIMTALLDGRSRTSPVNAPGTQVDGEVYDVMSYIRTELFASGRASGSDQAIVKIKKALREIGEEMEKRSGQKVETQFDSPESFVALASGGQQGPLALSALQAEYQALQLEVANVSLSVSFMNEEEDKEDGSKTVAELMTMFNEEVLPALRKISTDDIKGVADSITDLVINSSSLVDSLDKILDEVLRTETGREEQQYVNEAKKIKARLEEIDNVLDEIDDRALSLSSVGVRATGTILSQFSNVESISSFGPVDVVASALVIADTLTSPGPDVAAESPSGKKGIAIWVIENVTGAFGSGDRARAYTNIAMNVAFATASPTALQNEYDASMDNVGLNADQVAFIDAVMTGDGGVSSMSEFIDPYEVAKKILLYDAKRAKGTISLAADLRTAFFPGVTRGAITRSDTAEVSRLKPRNASLALRSKDIIQAQAATRRVASDYAKGGKEGELALKTLLSLGQYFASTRAVSGFGDIMSAPAPETAPTTPAFATDRGVEREFVPGPPDRSDLSRFPRGRSGDEMFAQATAQYREDVEAYNAATAPEITRVRSMSTAASQRNAMIQGAKRGLASEPRVLRPGGPGMGESDVDFTTYATAGDNVERFIKANSDMRVGDQSLDDLSLDEAIEAVEAEELDVSIKGSLDTALDGLKDLMVRHAMYSAGPDPDARERARAPAIRAAEETAGTTMLSDVKTEISRLSRLVLARKGSVSAPPAPTRPTSPTPPAGSTLTPEALELIRSVDAGGIPTMGITKNMVNIALANGVEKDLIDSLLEMENTSTAVKALIRLLKIEGGM